MKKSELKPRGDLVVVEKHDNVEKETEGGIVIPLNVGEAGITHATVKAIGPGHYLENGERAVLNDLKVGDIVLIDASKAVPLSVDDNKTFLLNQSAILAVVDGYVVNSKLVVHMPPAN